jgi:hypothetical protein
LKTTDTTRDAAAALVTELADIAARAARILEGDAPVPPIVIGKLLVAADKMNTRLRRHVERLTPARK